MSAGKHGTTYGGNPLACAAANAILHTIEADGLDANVRERGAQLTAGLRALQADFPQKIRTESIDVTDQASATALGECVAASGAKIDLVFNVAGVLHDAAQKKGPERALREIDAEWMMHVYAVNAVGPVVCTQALTPSLAKGAVVANVSARVGSIGDNRLGGWWSYRMSKAALNMATKNMAHELRRNEAGRLHDAYDGFAVCGRVCSYIMSSFRLHAF